MIQHGREDRSATSALIARAKKAVLSEYAHLAEEHMPLLGLALNEAEALAWDTGIPHLFFPVLAVEKAEAAVAWHQRQRAVQGAVMELAFAE